MEVLKIDPSQNKAHIDLSPIVPDAREELLENDEGINITNSEGKSLDVTKLDLFNLKGLSDEEIIKLIYKDLHIHISTPDGLEKINYLYNEAVTFYQKRYFKPVGKIGNKEFKSDKDVIKFLRDTYKKKADGRINCVLSKIVLGVSDVLECGAALELENKTEWLIADQLSGAIKYNDKNDGEYSPSQGGKIKFKYQYRGKKSPSIVGKSIGKADYRNAEDMKDGIGIRYFEVPNIKDALLILQEVYFRSYLEHMDNDKCEIECKIKGYNLEKIFEKDCSLFQPEFRKFVLDSNQTVNNRSHPDFKNIKISGKIPIPINPNNPNSIKILTGVEVQVDVKGINNDKGLTSQVVMDYFKRLDELIRLNGFIKENDIKRIVNGLMNKLDKKYDSNFNHKFFKELGESIHKEGYQDERYEDMHGLNPRLKYLSKGVYNYYYDKLTPVKIGNRRKQLYTNQRSYDLSNTDFYHDMKKVT